MNNLGSFAQYAVQGIPLGCVFALLAVGLTLNYKTSGVFNLFSPTEDPTLKLMVYEMGFNHGGKSYYLAGQKNVKEDPIIDLWKATTTLYSKLHEGTDKSGPVVGAGILSLGVRQLIHLVSTIEAPGATSFTEKSEAIAKFGRFFLGELWDTYVRHVPK